MHNAEAHHFHMRTNDLYERKNRNMREQPTDSVQNRFTAYLVAAVTNKRIRYVEQRSRQHKQEFAQMDLLERNYTDFDVQYHTYLSDRTAALSRDWEQTEKLTELIENRRLSNAILHLKERDRKLLFARVFGGLDFAELGEILHMETKQAEMAYYYVLRKIRRELGVKSGHEWRDEF
jgi:RNA polymerase sigma factor (sigma-70 family)